MVLSHLRRWLRVKRGTLGEIRCAIWNSRTQTARLTIMKLAIAIVIAVACGVGVGTGTAVLSFRENPWVGGVGSPPPDSGGEAIADADEFNFGRKDVSEDGRHEFTITNRGDRKLTLNMGTTSCRCTVSSIEKNVLAPGESTKIPVTWKSKRHAGPFSQSVTILTSDPDRPEVVFKIKGDFYRTVYADPDELTFNQITGTEPVVREARILTSLPDQPLKITKQELLNLSQAQFFGIESEPLPTEKLPKDNGAKSGILVRVTVKPGLPLGGFQQTIDLTTNLGDEPVKLHLFGSVGEVTFVGPGWSSETNVLEIGTLDGRSTTLRKLKIIVRGTNAEKMRFKVARVEPDFMKVTLGETKVDESGSPSVTELTIEIPDSKALGQKAPADFMGKEHGKLGEILLETTGPQPLSLPIHVRFALNAATGLAPVAR
jgi:hypothetical protein